MAAHINHIAELVSILMESPLYMTLSLDERHSLLKRLAQLYHHFEDEDGMQKEDDIE